MRNLRTLLDGLILPEGPRWRNGKLYVSDMIGAEVLSCDLQGNRERIVKIPAQPSGLGWLPDGRMLIACVGNARLVVFDGLKLEVVADLSGMVLSLNDMVVDRNGRAYVGAMPDITKIDVNIPKFESGDLPECNEKVLLVDCSQSYSDPVVDVAVDDINFPNGSVITDDGKTLLIAETWSCRILAFDIDSEGALENQRIWARLPGAPDGICLDAEGCLWAALAFPKNTRGIYRIGPGGELLEKIDADSYYPLAPMLGGKDGKSLFITEVRSMDYSLSESQQPGNGRVRVGLVDVPGAGLP